MRLLVYLYRAFMLMRYVVDLRFRQQTDARWKRTPRHIVILEIGGGVVGILILSGLTMLIVMEIVDRGR